MAKPVRVHIKPLMTDVGRGPEFARIPYKEGGTFRVLPPEGAMVDMGGSARSFWLRRKNEGAVEITEPAADRKAAHAPAPAFKKASAD